LQLRNQGVGVVAGAAFSTDGNPPNAIRVCLGGPQDRDDCRDSLQRVAETLNDPHHLHSDDVGGHVVDVPSKPKSGAGSQPE
jgi:hypothetical protein